MTDDRLAYLERKIRTGGVCYPSEVLDLIAELRRAKSPRPCEASAKAAAELAGDRP